MIWKRRSKPNNIFPFFFHLHETCSNSKKWQTSIVTMTNKDKFNNALKCIQNKGNNKEIEKITVSEKKSWRHQIGWKHSSGPSTSGSGPSSSDKYSVALIHQYFDNNAKAEIFPFLCSSNVLCQKTLNSLSCFTKIQPTGHKRPRHFHNCTFSRQANV